MKRRFRFLWGLPLALISNIDEFWLKTTNTVSETFVSYIFDISYYLKKQEVRLTIKLLILSLLFVITCFDEIESGQTVYEITRVKSVKKYEMKKILSLITYTAGFWISFSLGILLLSLVSTNGNISASDAAIPAKATLGLIFCEIMIALIANLISILVKNRSTIIYVVMSVIGMFVISTKLTMLLSKAPLVLSIYPITAMTFIFLSYKDLILVLLCWLIEMAVPAIAIVYLLDRRFNDEKNSFRKYTKIV